MIRIGKYILLLIIALDLIGCDSCQTAAMSDTSPENLQFVEQMLATDANCLPPCWQGLAPGVATQADVLATLAEISFVNKEHISQQKPSKSEQGFTDWEITASQSFLILGQARFDSEGSLIAIEFMASSEHPLQSLRSFGAVVEDFGEPDIYSIIPTHDYRCKWSKLIWLAKGIEIQTYPAWNEGDGPWMKKNKPVASIIYFIPQQTLKGYLRNIVGLSESQVQERLSDYQQWTGFNETGSGSNE